MSLDIDLEEIKPTSVFSANITHNLNKMADAAGIYYHVWRPEELGIERASDLITPLTDGIARLTADPAKFKAFNPNNGWGTYDGFVTWLQEYLQACIEHPTATIRANR
jgi:hypothetical protein